MLLKAMEIKEIQEQVQREIEQQYIQGGIPFLSGDGGHLNGSGNTALSEDQLEEPTFISYKAYNWGHDYRPVVSDKRSFLCL